MNLIENSEIICFRVRDMHGEDIKPWKSQWQLPRNLIASVGVPKIEKIPIRIAFCTQGGSTTHSALEPIAAPANSPYDCVHATLQDRDLQILVLPDAVRKAVEERNLKYDDPSKILSEKNIEILMKRLGAKKYRFSEDNRWGEATTRVLASQPPSAGITRTILLHQRQTSE